MSAMSTQDGQDLEQVAPGAARELRRALVSDAQIDEAIAQAGGQGITLTGDGGLLPELVKAVLERGLAVELDDHLGYVKGDPAAIHAALAGAYGDEPFLHVLPMGKLPSTRSIAGSNHVQIGVSGDRVPGRATVVVALDNLTKGSSGQALQNANLMLGLPETQGLTLAPVFP